MEIHGLRECTSAAVQGLGESSPILLSGTEYRCVDKLKLILDIYRDYPQEFSFRPKRHSEEVFINIITPRDKGSKHHTSAFLTVVTMEAKHRPNASAPRAPVDDYDTKPNNAMQSNFDETSSMDSDERYLV